MLLDLSLLRQIVVLLVMAYCTAIFYFVCYVFNSQNESDCGGMRVDSSSLCVKPSQA